MPAWPTPAWCRSSRTICATAYRWRRPAASPDDARRRLMAERQPIASSEVLPMFPTLVWKLQLDPEFHQALDAKILHALEDIRRDLPKLGPGQGWQSQQRLHELDQFRDLVACIGRTAQ